MMIDKQYSVEKKRTNPYKTKDKVIPIVKITKINAMAFTGLV